MESLLGVVGQDYVLIAADGATVRSVVKFKDTEDKIYAVDATKIMGVTGPTGDRVNFTEYILRNVHLYALRNGVSLSTHATANFTRCVFTRRASGWGGWRGGAPFFLLFFLWWFLCGPVRWSLWLGAGTSSPPPCDQIRTRCGA